MPEKLRLRFEKTGRAIYISHLDLMRTMQRVFLRADCPLKYSEGFNPHALISILLPLSVGVGSVCELMDFQLREDVDLAALPERLRGHPRARGVPCRAQGARAQVAACDRAV